MTRGVQDKIRKLIPHLQFEVPGQNQGQTVEVAFAGLKLGGRWYRVRRTSDRSDPDPLEHAAYSARHVGGSDWTAL